MTKTWHVERFATYPNLYQVVNDKKTRISSPLSLEDARLVAAAPEMFEALEAQELVLNSDGFGHAGWVACRVRARKLLKAVLAKARGGTVPDSGTRLLSGLPGESKSDREIGLENA